jgi:primosomal protein N' (replication factor Y)
MRIPKKCPTCEQEETLVSCGPGVERIHEEAHQLFPEARLSMVTSDTLNNPKEFEALLVYGEQEQMKVFSTKGVKQRKLK